MLVAGLLLVPGAASAEVLPAGCVHPDSAGPITCTYTEAGQHELVLPEGVTSVQVTAVGGHGGRFTVDAQAMSGGRGAVVTGLVEVPLGSRTVYAVVGGNGADTQFGADHAGGAGGLGGGADGGTPKTPHDARPGAGGGGASDIRTAADDVDSRVVVAAGGGGANHYGAGGDAGTPGAGDGGGRGGTAVSGGAAGTDSRYPTLNGLPGTLGVGGAGGPAPNAGGPVSVSGGGGGGGGLYGGGGGSIYGAGGGGSSMAPSGGTIALTTDGPSITITYQPPATPPNPSHPPCAGLLCIDQGIFGSS